MGITNASVVQRLKHQAHETYSDLGQRAHQFYSRTVENDRLTSTLTTLDPFRNAFSKDYIKRPWWGLGTIGAAATALGVSTFKICQSKWHAKPLWMRRILGPLFVLPVIYFGAYGVYTLFRKGTEWNKVRLEKKAQAEIQAKYDAKFEDIFKKSAKEQFVAIEKLATDDNLGLEWLTENGKHYVQLQFNIRKTPYAYKKEIDAVLYAEHTRVEADLKTKAADEKIRSEFAKIQNEFKDPQKSKPEIQRLFQQIYFRDMTPSGLDKTSVKLPRSYKTGGKYYLIIERNGSEILRQEVAQNTRNCIVKYKLGTLWGKEVTEELSDSTVDGGVMDPEDVNS